MENPAHGSDLWLATLQSFAILGAVVAGWSCLRHVVPWPWPSLGDFVFAVAMGSGTIIVMSMPVELVPGVRFDFRTSLLAAAALIGGPIMVIAGVIAAIYRIYLGGDGALSGVVAIMIATALGILFHVRRGKDPSFTTIALLSMLTSVCGLFTALLLPMPAFEKLSEWGLLMTTAMRIFATFLSAVVLRQDRISVKMAKDTHLPQDHRRAARQPQRQGQGRPLHRRQSGDGAPDARGQPGGLSGKTDFDFYPARRRRDLSRRRRGHRRGARP